MLQGRSEEVVETTLDRDELKKEYTTAHRPRAEQEHYQGKSGWPN